MATETATGEPVEESQFSVVTLLAFWMLNSVGFFLAILGMIVVMPTQATNSEVLILGSIALGGAVITVLQQGAKALGRYI